MRSAADLIDHKRNREPMKLSGSDGQSFELTILGYQFPNMNTEDFDSNWLIIQLDVHHPKGHWRSRDPCLLTYEVERLANFLEQVSRNEKVDAEEHFIEPNLKFRLLTPGSKDEKMRIYFELECRPSWAPSDTVGMEDLWVEFPVLEINLELAAQSLRDQLSIYPQRATV